MTAMRPAGNYDLTEIARLLLKMRDNCVRKTEGAAYDDPERKEKYEALEAAIDLINNPSMLQRWISVKNRLPEKKQRVLVYTTQEAYRLGAFSYVGKEGAVWFKCDKSCITCTHWMPLPKQPEEQEGADMNANEH